MEFKNLLTSDEERAVSPVIGVILMVAITVILAAVIGTFVLGLGDQVQETSPNTQWSWDVSDAATNEDLDVTHDGGDSVNPAQLEVRGLNAEPCDTDTAWGQSTVTAGATCTAVNDDVVDDEYRLVWTSDGGGQSSTLSRYDAS